MKITKYHKNKERCEGCGSKDLKKVSKDKWSNLIGKDKQDRKIWFKCQKCGNLQYIREIRDKNESN